LVITSVSKEGPFSSYSQKIPTFVLLRLTLHTFLSNIQGRTNTYVAEFLHHARHIPYSATEAWRQSFQLPSDVKIPL